MLSTIKQWIFDLILKLMENRTIRTWALCFALRHAPVAKFLAKIGFEESGEQDD